MIRAKKARNQTKKVNSLAKLIEDRYPNVARAVKQSDNSSSSDTSSDQIEAISDENNQEEPVKDSNVISTESSSSQFKIPKSGAAKSLKFDEVLSDFPDSSQDETVRSPY